MQSLLEAVQGKYGAILVDPPWRFANRTGKMAPEHKRLHRYPTMSFEDIAALPVGKIAAEKSHLYLWCPNALLAYALGIVKRWRNWRGSVPIGRSGERKRAALYQLPLVII